MEATTKKYALSNFFRQYSIWRGGAFFDF